MSNTIYTTAVAADNMSTEFPDVYAGHGSPTLPDFVEYFELPHRDDSKWTVVLHRTYWTIPTTARPWEGSWMFRGQVVAYIRRCLKTWNDRNVVWHVAPVDTYLEAGEAARWALYMDEKVSQ